MIGFSVESDWSRKWGELSGPIKARSKARTNNFWRELYFLDYLLMMMVHHYKLLQRFPFVSPVQLIHVNSTQF